MAMVSVLAFSRVNVLDGGAGSFLGFGVAGGVSLSFSWVRFAAGGAGEGEGDGLEPPIFNDIVGGGRGASSCSGRSTGGGGGGCCTGGGAPKALPGTNSKAPALSLLMVSVVVVVRGEGR